MAFIKAFFAIAFMEETAIHNSYLEEFIVPFACVPFEVVYKLLLLLLYGLFLCIHLLLYFIAFVIPACSDSDNAYY